MRPSFDDLSNAEKARFGNGVGPYWMPRAARNFITNTASWFFEDASWRHHDFGYCVGGDRWDRARCDWKFLRAMLRDAVSQPKWRIVRIPLAIGLALAFYAAVRLFGGYGSFRYRAAYASLSQVKSIGQVKSFMEGLEDAN